MTERCRVEADRELDDILGRVTCIGPESRPSEDEMMDIAAAAVRPVRWARVGKVSIIVGPESDKA